MNPSAPTSPLLWGVGMSGYRSLREPQYLAPLSKVTLLAGQNNAGKSNVLRFVDLLSTTTPGFDWHDAPQPEGPPLRVSIAYPTPTEDALAAIHGQLPRIQGLLETLARFPQPVEGDAVWITYSPGPDNQHGRPSKGQWTIDETFMASVVDRIAQPGQQAISAASSALFGQSGGERTADLGRVLGQLFPYRKYQVESVGAFRRIAAGAGQSDTDDHNGSNLVQRLASLKSPPARDYDAHRRKFDAINQFARVVFEDRSVEIEIPSDNSELLIKQGGRVLPLDSKGTGIHQVVILAAAATTLEETLVCIEEPEVHLHPLLQRKLVQYLAQATSNQYLIATHSAHMLDYQRATVFHVKAEPETGTALFRASSPQAASDICTDLGYRPSDLIQSNAVIWVEGPSDRIYLKFWLDRVYPNRFVEGIHYSVMFYGGSLLKHLSADDPSIDEFISLRRLNRHSAIMIDSDRSRAGAPLNDTKRRIIDEFDQPGWPGFAWITDCRTIENYIPVDVLSAAVSAVHPRSNYSPPSDKWAHPLSIESSRGSSVEPAKIKIARRVVQGWPDSPLPKLLAARLEAVADFVQQANPGSETILAAY